MTRGVAVLDKTPQAQENAMELAEETGRLLCWYLPDWIDGLSILNWLGTCRQARVCQRGTSWPAKFLETVDFTTKMMAYMRKHHIMPANEDYMDYALQLLRDDKLPITLPSPVGQLVIDNTHAGEYREHVAMCLNFGVGIIEGNSFKEFLEVLEKLDRKHDEAWCKDPAFQTVRDKLVEGNARFFVSIEFWDSLLHGPEYTDSCECIYLVFQYHNFYFALCTWPDIQTFL